MLVHRPQVSVSIGQMLSCSRMEPCREHHTIPIIASTRTLWQLPWQRKCARHLTRSCSQWRPSSISPLNRCKMSLNSFRWYLLPLHWQVRPVRHGCRLANGGFLGIQVDYDDEVEEPASEMPGQRHPSTARQKTRADHNRQQRKRKLEQAAQCREAIKKQRRDMDQLQVLQAEIEEEEAHVAARNERRQVRGVELCAACKQERLMLYQ